MLLASCASIVSKNNYPVALTSNPSGSHVVVKNSSGESIHQGVTPTTVTLAASEGYFKPATYTVEFSKKGKAKQIVTVSAGMDGWYFGNIVLGGLIGMLVVDPLTGSMWKLDSTVNADFQAVATLDAGNGRSIAFIDRASIPAHMEKKLVSLR